MQTRDAILNAEPPPARVPGGLHLYLAAEFADAMAPVPAALDTPEDGLRAIAATTRRLRGVLAGLEAWAAHPFRRPDPARPVLWQAGRTRLLDGAPGHGGPPVLVLPSLINRAEVLDLLPGWSLIDGLASRGLRPLLMDWGPAAPELGLDALLDTRLAPALDLAGRGARLLGYCMGGTLAAAAAMRGLPAARVATLGAPWGDALGGTGGPTLRLALRAAGPALVGDALDALAERTGLIPAPVFEALFAALEPLALGAKFRRFAAMDPASAAAQRFVALEDWLAAPRHVALPVARTLLVDWPHGAAPASGRWHLAGGPVRAADLRVPLLAVTGARDHIAAPASALLLPEQARGQSLITPLGHVGLIASRRAPRLVWDPVAAFLRDRE